MTLNRHWINIKLQLRYHFFENSNFNSKAPRAPAAVCPRRFKIKNWFFKKMCTPTSCLRLKKMASTKSRRHLFVVVSDFCQVNSNKKDKTPLFQELRQTSQKFVKSDYDPNIPRDVCLNSWKSGVWSFLFEKSTTTASFFNLKSIL